jgi:ribosome-associated translation inhibitor RaiA
MQFRNFIPTLDLEKNAKSMLSRLFDFMPYDSSSSATIEREGDSYVVSIEIISNWGKFIARNVAESPRSALDLACRSMKTQIAKWHSLRFEPAASPA